MENENNTQTLTTATATTTTIDTEDNNPNPDTTPYATTPSIVIANLLHHIHQTIILKYWDTPDYEAMEIVIAFLGAYYLHESNPLWLHLVGPPGSAKTALGLAPVYHKDYYRDFWQLGNITEQTLLSGLATGKQGGKSNSLLHRIGAVGCVVMPDFTNFLSKDYRIVEAIAGQLREVWDGETNKQTGASDGKNSSWEGRVSWITAMTPDAERHWTRHNPKGERFAIIRWQASRNHEAVADKILQQVGSNAQSNYYANEAAKGKAGGGNGSGKSADLPEVQLTPTQLVSSWFRVVLEGAAWEGDLPGLDGMDWKGSDGKLLIGGDLAVVPPIKFTVKPLAPGRDIIGGLWKMAQVVSLLRSIPSRPDGKHIGQLDMETGIESPARLQFQFIQCLRGWAFLHRREVRADDMRLVKRLAMDSIPLAKRSIVEGLVLMGEGGVSLEDLMVVGQYRSLPPLIWQMEELEALGIAEGEEGGMKWKMVGEWRVTDKFAELWKNAFG